MRADIKMLCITNWGAVLELKTHPYYWVTEYGRGHIPSEIVYKYYNSVVTVADPDAIDAGMIIGLDEIKLVARLKHWNNDGTRNTQK